MPKITMRTLQIGDDWIAEREGGLGRYYFELQRHLEATGTSASGLVVGSPWIADSTGGQTVAFARPEDPLFTRLRACRRFALDRIDAGQVDLIASHFALYALPIVDRLRSTPTVVHFHGPWSGESGFEGAASLNARFKNMIEKVVYARTRLFIVLSKSFREELIRGYGVPEERIRVVPGGIDIDRFNMDLSREEARRRLSWPTDRPIILTVRRQVRRMGLENLIEAAQLLVRQHPDLLVLLGGSGPISGELQTLIMERRLEHNVRLLGRIDDKDLPLAYRAADMTVVPSQSLEGFGLITLESLATGTPVYVTPVGGLPEILEPFASRCVFSGTSSGEIAATLGEALGGTHPPSEQECRSYAVEGFSWSKIAGKVRAVYDEAIQ